MANSSVDIIPYIPCHFDHSQIEYIMPFLSQWGGKVFIYPSHYSREKFTKYFSSIPNVEVFIFSLETIVKCILSEKRKVVWILTGSTAYDWGKYQRNVLSVFTQVIPEKVVDICQIGHCMYGCLSCGGNEHNIPIYFTRYFNKTLPYNAEDIKIKFFAPNVKNVIVCPSTADTSMLLQNWILDYLLELEKQGKHHFVWKFHPSVFNDSFYDLNDETERREYENVQWIRKNFVCVPEEMSCLLPFFEAYETILCDLHSSVPFIASYFCPRIIIAYENDTGYEGVVREEAYLSMLNTFQTKNQLLSFFEHSPAPKGDSSFFTQKYGIVDGKEHFRIADLRKWPVKTISEQSGAKESESNSISSSSVKDTPVYQNINEIWQKMLEESQNNEDMLDTIGLSPSNSS